MREEMLPRGIRKEKAEDVYVGTALPVGCVCVCVCFKPVFLSLSFYHIQSPSHGTKLHFSPFTSKNGKRQAMCRLFALVSNVSMLGLSVCVCVCMVRDYFLSD